METSENAVKQIEAARRFFKAGMALEMPRRQVNRRSLVPRDPILLQGCDMTASHSHEGERLGGPPRESAKSATRQDDATGN